MKLKRVLKGMFQGELQGLPTHELYYIGKKKLRYLPDIRTSPNFSSKPQNLDCHYHIK